MYYGFVYIPLCVLHGAFVRCTKVTIVHTHTPLNYE